MFLLPPPVSNPEVLNGSCLTAATDKVLYMWEYIQAHMTDDYDWFMKAGSHGQSCFADSTTEVVVNIPDVSPAVAAA